MNDMRQWMQLFESASGLVTDFKRRLDRFNQRGGPVWVDLVPTGANEVTIESITSENRKQGFGNEVMKMLCTMADQYHVTLKLQPVSYADYGEAPGGLGMDDLIMWYERFGFEMDYQTGFMYR